jgi:hypothetical protein
MHVIIVLHRKEINSSSNSQPLSQLFYGAQESIPRNRLLQPMLPGGPARQIGLSYRPARLGIDSWAP